MRLGAILGGQGAFDEPMSGSCGKSGKRKSVKKSLDMQEIQEESHKKLNRKPMKNRRYYPPQLRYVNEFTAKLDAEYAIDLKKTIHDETRSNTNKASEYTTEKITSYKYKADDYKSTSSNDPYNVNDYSNEEDFYDDHYYDFFDYYDAENYYRRYHD